MKYSIRTILLLFLGGMAYGSLRGQSLPVGTPVLEDWYRRAQLLGTVDSSLSFCARPLFPEIAFKAANRFDPDSSLARCRWKLADNRFAFGNHKAVVEILPFTLLQQINTDHAWGMNDGLMIPAKGYQTLVSGGFSLNWGPLAIQLRPEYLYADNPAEKIHRYNGVDYYSQIDGWYADYIYKIDLPDRFGNKPYQKASWGQSSIRLNLGAVSLGLSNENLWWGPGMYNTLLMTNNAPGFKHLTLNTARPVRTPIGSLEWQVIAGKLEGSGFAPDKPNDWRYLNGMTATYQPRWVPGLFLGFTRCYQTYSKKLGHRFSNYLPVFDVLTKKSGGGDAQDALDQDQLVSLFMRWLWAREESEIYLEYGREDHAWNMRDLMMEPTSSAAYNLGFRKLIPIKKSKTNYIDINLELTQLEMDIITINRQGASWYTHYQLLNGYTNFGQVLGAGIGPGSNLQTIAVSWHHRLRSIGLQFNRYEHNNDFFQTYIKDIRTNWVDLSAALTAEWNYRNLLINMKFETIRSKNYKWHYAPLPGTEEDYFKATHDVMNFHGELGVTYRF